MKCFHCGSENADNIKFCTNCGAPLANASNQNMQGQANFNQQNQFNGQQQFNPQNQFNGQPQFNPQNQFNGQNQFNPQNQFNGQQQFNPQNQFGGMPPMTKKQFYKQPGLKGLRNSITTAAVLMYISAGLTFIVTVLLDGYYFVLLDIALLIGMALGIQLEKSRTCAIIMCIYSIINMIVSAITTGTASGIWVIVASILAVNGTFKFQKAWKKYQQTGMMPTI